MARRRFTREFKVSAIKLVEEEGYSVCDAARSLGVDPSTLRAWVERYKPEASAMPGSESELKAEVQRLRKENARLVMEREILKKAAAFFAKDQP